MLWGTGTVLYTGNLLIQTTAGRRKKKNDLSYKGTYIYKRHLPNGYEIFFLFLLFTRVLKTKIGHFLNKNLKCVENSIF